jgi:hypothetical protein
MKDVQAKGEALSPQKITPALQKMKFFSSLRWIIFDLLDADPDPDLADQIQCGSMRIRIHNTGNNISL